MELKNIEAAAALKAKLDAVDAVSVAMNPGYRTARYNNEEPKHEISFKSAEDGRSRVSASVSRLTLERAIELERADLTAALAKLGVNL